MAKDNSGLSFRGAMLFAMSTLTNIMTHPAGQMLLLAGLAGTANADSVYSSEESAAGFCYPAQLIAAAGKTFHCDPGASDCNLFSPPRSSELAADPGFPDNVSPPNGWSCRPV